MSHLLSKLLSKLVTAPSSDKHYTTFG